MKILLTTDGAKQAEVALQTASRILRKNMHSYDLLCVAPKLDFPPLKAKKEKPKIARMHKNYQDKIKLEAREILLHAQARLAALGIDANPIIEVGSPASVILRHAVDSKLVVVGAHDRYERSKKGLGPVATRVVAHTPNAVLVARDLTAGKNLRILLCVDGSLASEHAVSLMLRLFEIGTAEITLLHVVEAPWLHLGLERDWSDYAEGGMGSNDESLHFEHELKAEAEDVLSAARLQVERFGLAVSTLVEQGDPALEILSEAEKEDYDLIVLGATGEHDLKHQLLGSVSTKVAQDAPCSVLVARYVG